MIMERIMRSTHMTTRWLNLTGTSVAIRHGTKLARKMIEVTGMTANIYRIRILHVPTVTSKAGMVTSMKLTAAPVDATAASFAGSEMHING